MLPRNRMLIQEQYLSDQNRSIMMNVTRHVFTLRADMARLRRFIDSYLNFVDDDMPPPFYFQPAAPYVTFELIYYPYLTVASRNLIAYPQREMSFTVPLECYAIEDGVLVFKQYAFCVPFLYVDEEFSIVSGRDLFGLPKVAIQFKDLIEQVRPDTPAQIGRLALRVPGPRGDRYVPFIEVYQEPSKFASLRQAPGKLLSTWPEAIRGYYSLAAEAWQSIARPPLLGYLQQRDLSSMAGMSRALAEAQAGIWPAFPPLREAPHFAESSADELLGSNFMDIITLKQARDAERPEFVSFQGLVKSAMYIDRINDGGFLFSPLVSDPSDAVTIKIHRIAGQPVVDSLGLIADEAYGPAGDWRWGHGKTEYDAPDAVPMMSTIKPLVPYWMNVDLMYGLGTNLYWRGRETDWSSTDCPGPPSGYNRYITMGSGALDEDASRIVSPDSHLWVFQLPLDYDNNGPERLNRLCAEYLHNDCYAFRLAPLPHGLKYCVWMFIRKLNNTSEGPGPDREQEISFATVLDWYHKKDGRPCGPPITRVLMPLFVLTDNQVAALTETEVFGYPTMRGDMNFTGSDWTSTKFPAASMNARTLLMPELYSGDAAELRRIVSVNVTFGSPQLQGQKLLALRVLNLPVVDLKQIEDCRLPDRAGFQAIVSRVLAVRPESGASVQYYPKPGGPVSSNYDYSVNIDRYGSLPLVEKMGLKVKEIAPGEYTTIDKIEPNAVWSVRASVEELGAVNLAWREGNSPWISHENPLAELKKMAPALDDIVTAMANPLTHVVFKAKKIERWRARRLELATENAAHLLDAAQKVQGIQQAADESVRLLNDRVNEELARKIREIEKKAGTLAGQLKEDAKKARRLKKTLESRGRKAR